MRNVFVATNSSWDNGENIKNDFLAFRYNNNLKMRQEFKNTLHSRKFCRLSAHQSVKTALDLEPISLELLKLQERYVLRWKA